MRPPPENCLGVPRNGIMRDLILGLEVMLPDMRICNDPPKQRKTVRYKPLLIGREALLGDVTAACLTPFSRPTRIETAGSPAGLPASAARTGSA